MRRCFLPTATNKVFAKIFSVYSEVFPSRREDAYADVFPDSTMHLCCRLRFLCVSGAVSGYEHRFFDADCASAGGGFLPSITILSMSTKWLISLKESREKKW